jgi:hypothetical protein
MKSYIKILWNKPIFIFILENFLFFVEILEFKNLDEY